MNTPEWVEIEEGFTLWVNAQRKPRADERGKLIVELRLAEQFACPLMTEHLEGELRRRYGNCTAWDTRGPGQPHTNYVVEMRLYHEVLTEAAAKELLAAQVITIKAALEAARAVERQHQLDKAVIWV